jgi:hypothetical protein
MILKNVLCLWVHDLNYSSFHPSCDLLPSFACSMILRAFLDGGSAQIHLLYFWWCNTIRSLIDRDGNSVMGIRYPSGIWSDGYRYRDNFLPTGGTRTRPESRRIRDMYFFPPAGNPTGTGYFTTAIILGCEQVKCVYFVILTMTCSDCWILLLGYLKYLLNINFEHVYIMFYSLN